MIATDPLPATNSFPNSDPFPGSERARSIAGVDLGSNSFHLVVGEIDHGRVQIIDRLKETVRLAAGLDDQRRLTREATERALQTLRRFGERLAGIPSTHVRVVGTNALRQARNSRMFLTRGAKALGHPIEVISGQEEARLIYAGVAHSIPADDDLQRLVIDIGGGSTELIIGQGRMPLKLESLFMGCVSLSKQHFADGRLTRKRMKEAVLAARRELEAIEVEYRQLGWEAVLGSSGTILSIFEFCEDKTRGITPADLRRLRKQLLAAGHVDELVTTGVSVDRAPVFPGGVAILCGAFEALGLEQMSVSVEALREGLLYDIVNRLNRRDIRDDTVLQLMSQYRVDTEHAERVADTAARLVAQAQDAWKLSPASDGRLLDWSTRLHEIGRSVSHTQYHRHGEYLVRHHDMRGFSRQEQSLLATLIRCHRRRLPMSLLDDQPKAARTRMTRLCVLLRLAVLVNRSRSPQHVEALTLDCGKNRLSLTFPRGWLQRHPLTEADLEQEAVYLEAARFYLRFQ